MDRCDRCDEFIFPSFKEVAGVECSCIEFLIVDDDGEEHEIFANHADDAAIKFATDYNENCGYLLIGNEMKITVDGVPYVISAEADVCYSAEAMRPDIFDGGD